MSKGVGSGDKLARGAVSARFSTTEGGMSQEKWNSMFDDYDPEEFKNAPNKSRQPMQPVEEVSGGDTDVAETGVPSADVKKPAHFSNSD